MSKQGPITRPTFEEANRAWKQALEERKLPSDLVWIFGDNLCLEESQPGGQNFQVSYQTAFSAPPPEAEKVAYRYFCGFETPLVFYRLGSNRGRSVCLLLCDEWFESKGERDGFFERTEWRISFRPGGTEQVEEITDAQRWAKRSLRRSEVSELDFAMDLRAVHEILAHGRVLSSYEHYALRFLHIWRRMFEERGLFHH
jgi:hypothetical protein